MYVFRTSIFVSIQISRLHGVIWIVTNSNRLTVIIISKASSSNHFLSNYLSQEEQLLLEALEVAVAVVVSLLTQSGGMRSRQFWPIRGRWLAQLGTLKTLSPTYMARLATSSSSRGGNRPPPCSRCRGRECRRRFRMPSERYRRYWDSARPNVAVTNVLSNFTDERKS